MSPWVKLTIILSLQLRLEFIEIPRKKGDHRRSFLVITEPNRVPVVGIECSGDLVTELFDLKARTDTFRQLVVWIQ